MGQPHRRAHRQRNSRRSAGVGRRSSLSTAAEVFAPEQGTGRRGLTLSSAFAVQISFGSVARSPSGKAMVCKTIIGGAFFPPAPPTLFPLLRGGQPAAPPFSFARGWRVFNEVFFYLWFVFCRG